MLLMIQRFIERGWGAIFTHPLIHKAQHFGALHWTALYWSVLHCTALHCTALQCTTLYCTALQCTTLYCTALHCSVLPCTALHCLYLLSHYQRREPNSVDWSLTQASNSSAVFNALSTLYIEHSTITYIYVSCSLNTVLFTLYNKHVTYKQIRKKATWAKIHFTRKKCVSLPKNTSFTN